MQWIFTEAIFGSYWRKGDLNGRKFIQKRNFKKFKIQGNYAIQKQYSHRKTDSHIATK